MGTVLDTQLGQAVTKNERAGVAVSAGEYQADERAGVARLAGEYQADEWAGVARLSWRVSGR